MPPHTPADTLEIELIRSLFDAKMPAVIMTACFIATGSLAVWQTGDPMLKVLLGCGTLTSFGRLGVLWRRTDECMAAGLPIARARSLEQLFGLTYVGFALILGLMAGRMVQMPYPALHMLAICLVLGYGSGVAARAGLRPRIATPSMMLASLPVVVAAIAHFDAAFWVGGAMICAFLTGGVDAVEKRHAAMVQNISRRIAFSKLARQDGLTGLANRLALREWFDERAGTAGSSGWVAVHYLDLNGFKPVNDRYGHPVGDALLVAVSGRIARTIRGTDFAARLGGDEFAVVQFGPEDPADAGRLAQRLADAIAQPYQIEGNAIHVSTCIGYAIADRTEADYDHLLHAADEALYASKRAGGGITRWLPTCEVARHLAAA